jgi:hypothetical protein
MDGLEFIAQAFGEGLIHPFLKSIGALLRWPFLFRNIALGRFTKNQGMGGLGYYKYR